MLKYRCAAANAATPGTATRIPSRLSVASEQLLPLIPKKTISYVLIEFRAMSKVVIEAVSKARTR